MKLFAVMAVVVVLFGAGARAHGAQSTRDAKIARAEAERIALERAPGTILEVELERERGRLLYEIEIRLDSGVVREIGVDAETGEIVSDEIEDEDDDDDDEEDDDDPK